jgi:hypothetical protein
MLMTILVILLILSLAGGGFGYTRFGYAGWSPVGIIILICVILWWAGYLNLGHGLR